MRTIFQQHCLLRISKWVNTIMLWEDGRQSPKMLSSKYRPRPRERLLMFVHGRDPACGSQGVHSCTHMHAGKHTEPRYMKYEAVGLFLPGCSKDQQNHTQALSAPGIQVVNAAHLWKTDSSFPVPGQQEGRHKTSMHHVFYARSREDTLKLKTGNVKETGEQASEAATVQI